jgi:hypothetical protein
MKTVETLLRAYPADVQVLANGARDLIRNALPDAQETADQSAPIVSFGYGPGYRGMVCTLILSKKGVKLGIVRGSELADPRGLLQGSGKVHKSVQFRVPADLRQPGLKPLLAAAFAAWKNRQRTGPGVLLSDDH